MRCEIHHTANIDFNNFMCSVCFCAFDLSGNLLAFVCPFLFLFRSHSMLVLFVVGFVDDIVMVVAAAVRLMLVCGVICLFTYVLSIVLKHIITINI